MTRFDPAAFRDLVSGRRRGLRARLLRGALRVAEVPYTLAVRWRNWRYDTGRAEIARAEVPVVSVGNLTLGGTGKTPMVEWIARWLRQREWRVAIISRGYGATDGRNDEALELEQRLPDVPHLQNPDRVAAVRVAVEELESQILLLDDGFQHRRLARDLDVVLLDAAEPFGYGHVFPRGMLREPRGRLRQAHVVVLSRADMVSADERAHLCAAVAREAPGVPWVEVCHAPRCLLAASGEESSLEGLRGARVAAFCGIGNPAGFRHTLERCGAEVVAFREFPDHHAFDRADVASLAAWVDASGASMAVATHKDMVKLGIDQLGAKPVRALVIGLEFLGGREAFEQKLEGVIRAVC